MKLKGKYLGLLCPSVPFKSIFDSLTALTSIFCRITVWMWQLVLQRHVLAFHQHPLASSFSEKSPAVTFFSSFHSLKISSVIYVLSLILPVHHHFQFY